MEGAVPGAGTWIAVLPPLLAILLAAAASVGFLYVVLRVIGRPTIAAGE